VRTQFAISAIRAQDLCRQRALRGHGVRYPLCSGRSKRSWRSDEKLTSLSEEEILPAAMEVEEAVGG
jgi:hypothetical protein